MSPLVTIRQATDAIAEWPETAQLEWRELLDTDPTAARLIAEAAVLLDAVPVDPDGNPMIRRGIRPGLIRPGLERRAPDEARHLLARLHHDEESHAA